MLLLTDRRRDGPRHLTAQCPAGGRGINSAPSHSGMSKLTVDPTTDVQMGCLSGDWAVVISGRRLRCPGLSGYTAAGDWYGISHRSDQVWVTRGSLSTDPAFAETSRG